MTFPTCQERIRQRPVNQTMAGLRDFIEHDGKPVRRTILHSPFRVDFDSVRV